MASPEGRHERAAHYWVWVARPDYYLNDDDEDRRDLEPGRSYEQGAPWTCHKDTKDGDLVLLYRSRLRQDIDYRFRFAPTRIGFAMLMRSAKGGITGAITRCWRSSPILLLRADPTLADWGALRANFRRRVYPIPEDIWNRLTAQLADDRRRIRPPRFNQPGEVTTRPVEEGQVEGYDVATRAVLLPGQPDADLGQLLASQDIAVIWLEGDGYADDAGGAFT